MKTLIKILKILFFPVFTIGILLKTNLFPYFFQSTDVDYIVYKFLYPAQQVIYPLDTLWICWILISLFFILTSLLIHILIKDKDIRIGIKITAGLFFVLFLIFFCLIWQDEPHIRKICPDEIKDERIMIEQCE